MDDANGGNMGMCVDAIREDKLLDFSDFTEKADMIHLKFSDYDEDFSFISKLKRKFKK